MEYTTQGLAKLAKISTRTLRYYDEIGLLSPIRKSSNGYRIYGEKEVDRLQQILIYKDMGIPLLTIKEMMENPEYNQLKLLEEHLKELKKQQEEMELRINYVNATIGYLKGERKMSDKQKFEIYEKEAREKYGDEAVEYSKEQSKLSRVQELEEEIKTALKEAVEEGNPEGELAQKACALHQEWIKCHWKTYSKEAHLGLCQMYLQDSRFYEYYEKVAPKCADFLLEAMKIYLSK